MSADRDETLRLYIERVAILQRERGRRLGLEEMKAVALEVGIGADDLAAADAVAAAHVERGERFLEFRRWDDAITQLEDALTLSPDSLPALEGLSRAHAERWMLNGRPVDRDIAARYARRCLEIDPGHGASYALLNRLDAPRILPPARSAPRRRKIMGAALALCAVMLVLIASGTFRRRPVLPPDPPLPAEPAVVEPMIAVAVPDVGPPIPVTWECGRPEGANVEVAVVPGLGSDLELRVLNTGRTVLEEIVLRLKMGGRTFEASATRGAIAPGDYALLHIPAVTAERDGGINGEILQVR